jgi:large subunit ribosomal protein L15
MSDVPERPVETPRIRKPVGATRKRRVVGRGAASGRGGTSGRGTKGQRARAGSGVRPWFEGGQTPLYRRIARRGFSNHPFRKVYQVLDVRELNRFTDGTTVDRQALLEAGVIRSIKVPVKLLGSGDLERSLTVRIDRASAGARQKVTAAGGSIHLIDEGPEDGSAVAGSGDDDPS